MKVGFIILIMMMLNLYSYSQYSEKKFQESVEEFEKGNFPKADSLITIAINYERSTHKDYLKYYNRGIYRMSVDSITLAIMDFDTSIFLKSDFYPAYENKAICHYIWGDKNFANKSIDLGLKTSPNELEGYVLSCIINIGLGNYQKSITACSKALTIKKDPRLYAYRAISNIYLKKFEVALEDIVNGESIFGSGNQYLLEARIFYLYKKSNKEFCELMKVHYKLYEQIGSIDFNDPEFTKKYNDCSH